MVFRPRGKVNTFWNATDERVRFYDMFLNQNLDEYLLEFFRLIGGDAEEESGLSTADQLEAPGAGFDSVQYHDQRQSIIQEYSLNG